MLYKTALKYKISDDVVGEMLISPSDVSIEIANLDNDQKFYPISQDSSQMIDTISASSNILAPLAWFDKQNVCNKFVVSVLDMKSASESIKVSRFSRR